MVAFGDADNDKEMLESVGVGVAMANATAVAKTAAARVSEFTNDENAVALEIEAMVASGEFGQRVQEAWDTTS